MFSRGHRAPVWLFVLFSALYVLTMGGRTYSPDDRARYDLAVAIAERGSLEIPASPCASAETNDGRIYAKSGLGQPLLLVPLYLAGRALESLRLAPGVITAPMIASTLNQWIGAALVALLFVAGTELGYGLSAAAFTAVAFGVGTMLWPNAKFAFEHPLAALLLLGAFVALVRFRNRDGVRRAAAAGVLLAAVLLVRPTDFAVAAIPLGIYFLNALRRARRPAPALAAFAAPIALAAASVLAYNYARFDDLLESGYDDVEWAIALLPKGLFGLVLSPGKSVLLWNLPLVAALMALGAHWRRHRAEALVETSLALGFLIVYGAFNNWHGDWCVGPRYILPIVPFLLLSLGDGLADPVTGRRVRLALAAAIPLAAVIELVGLSVDYWPYFERFRNDVDGRNFVPARAQLFVYWEFIRGGEFSLFWVDVFADATPAWLRSLIVVPIVGVCAGILGLARSLGAPVRGDAGSAPSEPRVATTISGSRVLRRPRSSALVLSGVALALAAAIVLSLRSRSPSPDRAADDRHGLIGRYFSGTDWSGEPALTRTDALLDFDWRGRRRPLEGPFSVEWTGTLAVPATGAYKFFLRSRDGSWLWIDERLVIDNAGLHGVRQIAAAAVLTAGPHAIRLRAFDSNFAGAQLRLAWKPKGRLLHEVVGGTAIAPSLIQIDSAPASR